MKLEKLIWGKDWGQYGWEGVWGTEVAAKNSHRDYLGTKQFPS